MREKGFSSIFVLISILVTVGLVAIGFAFFKEKIFSSKTPSIIEKEEKGKWVGVLGFQEGFVKIDPQGNPERDDNSEIKITAPNWLTSRNSSPYDFFDLTLLKDGRLVSYGGVYSYTPKRNTLYYWHIDSSEPPKPLIELPEDQLIESFAFSPDNKQVAIISLTEQDPRLDDPDKLSDEEFLRLAEEDSHRFQEEIRTVTIYEVSKGKILKTLKLRELEKSERRTRNVTLTWTSGGLFVLTNLEGALFNPESGQLVATITRFKSYIDVSSKILISPNGLKYLNTYDLTVKEALTGTTVGQISREGFISEKQFNEGEIKGPKVFYVIYSAFSTDSKKLLIQNSDRIILEFNLETGQTTEIFDDSPLTAAVIPEGGRGLLYKGSILIPDSFGGFKSVKVPTKGSGAFFLGWYLSK